MDHRDDGPRRRRRERWQPAASVALGRRDRGTDRERGAVVTVRAYTVIGGGAIGGTLASALVTAGHPVVVVDVDDDHVASISRNGLVIRSPDGTERGARLSAYTPAQADGLELRFERVLLAVKGPGATAQAADWLAPRLAPDGFVVSVQNGLHEPVIAARVGQERTVGAFVDFFADVTEPGVIADGGAGSLVVGELDGTPSVRVDTLAEDLSAWGPAAVTDNVMGFLWSKLGFGAMLAATALADAPMADLIDRHRDVMARLARDVYRVAATVPVRLEPFDGYQPHAFVDGAEPDVRAAGFDRLVTWLAGQSKTRSGVWRDIAVRRRPSEATDRQEELVAMGERAGVATPHLALLASTLRQLESGDRAMSEDNLRILEDATCS
ncbi:MAG: ketopantoate reductase family protein [Streptosporangiales bacterium]|nr:ketopantoate reductase family protein [Streptosporangiales bacterium]